MEQLFDRYRSLEAHPRDKTQIVQLRKILSGIKKECNELSKLLTPPVPVPVPVLSCPSPCPSPCPRIED